MNVTLKRIFNRKPSIHISQDFQVGEIVAYFGGEPDYGLFGYARIISPEDYEKLNGKPIPDAGKFLERWSYEARKNGFVYVKTYVRNDVNDIFYGIMPTVWIDHKVEDRNEEIKHIQEMAKYNIKDVRQLSKASIDFLKSKN